jgi:fructose-1,6-bisphosphatase/inositol monophosphatase family enzyme
LDTFGFTLTLVHEETPLATIIDFPKLGKTYKAYRHQGATVNEMPIHVRKGVSEKGLFATSDDYAFKMSNRQEVLPYLRELPCIVRTQTDIHAYCLVAEGKFMGKFDAAGALWDLWPGYLLITEAGGECLFFPAENPTDDLAGSMLLGSRETVRQVFSGLQAKFPHFSNTFTYVFKR